MTDKGISPSPAHGRFKLYPSYKDSDVDWLGKIPEHWKILALKRVCRLGYGDSLSEEERREGDFAVYGSNGPVGIHDRSNTLGPCLVVGRKGSFGKVNYSPNPIFAIDTTFYIDSRHTKADFRWLYYVLTWLRLDSISKDSAIPGLDREDAYACSVPACSFEEQIEIALFLDRETAEIDALAAKKQRLIALLQEKRSALITKAVTKGLDPNVPMKDSGIESLGKIPAHWAVQRAKALEKNAAYLVQTGPFGVQLHASDYLGHGDAGVPLILIKHVNDLAIAHEDLPQISEDTAGRLSEYRVKAGDIVFSRVGTVGRIGLVTEQESGWLISGQMLRLRFLNSSLLSSYALYAISSDSVLAYFDLMSVGTTRDSINTTILRDMPLPLPTVHEQHTIVAFLDRETAKIDNLLAKTQEAIDRLKEYRTALISAAVTGKIDVRNEIMW